MATPVEIAPEDPRELVIARRMAAPAMALYRCWTEPGLIVRWFAPAPLTTEVKQMDVRPGGASRLTMRSPDGQEFPGDGVYLALEPGRRIVFTDAYADGWKASANPMFTADLSFEDVGGGESLYVARARHWTAEACEQHRQMGFHDGWGLCAEQLEAVAKTL